MTVQLTPDQRSPGTFFADWAEQNGARRPVRWTRQRLRPLTDGPRRARRRTAAAMVGIIGAGTALVLAGSGATADPSANDWYRLRMCESSNNYRINTGNGYYGAYQFDLSTWRSVGGRGYPNQASPAEQDARALLLYRMRGWQPWTCASIVGLREDGDARSGRTSDINVGSGGMVAQPEVTPGIPRFPGGSHWYTFGETSRDIKVFQDQMHRRGFFPVGTGEYGPNTYRMVTQLQRLNGLVPNGYIGPNTWRLAWTGKYTPAAAAAPKPAPRPVPRPEPARATVPAFPGGSHWYFYGETNRNIKVFQDQMHRRGFFPVGTGEYGPNTYRMVTQLQRLNGLVPNGLIGPHTWRLAWTGKYRLP